MSALLLPVPLPMGQIQLPASQSIYHFDLNQLEEVLFCSPKCDAGNTHTHREWRKEIFFFWIVRIRINVTKPWRWISLRRWRKHCWMKKRRGKLNPNLWESVHHLDKALFLNNWMHLGAEILEARMKRRGCDKFKIVYIYHPNKLNKTFLDLRSH